MKNKLMIGTIAAAIVLGGAAVAGATNKDNSVNEVQQTVVKEKQYMNKGEAIDIAFTQADGFVSDVDFEFKDGKRYYEIEIKNKAEKKEYEIKIDASTGEVLSVDVDDWHYKGKGSIRNSEQWKDDNEEVFQGEVMDIQEATKIAEKEVNGKVIEIDRDEEDGLLVYEFELMTDQGEVELVLDAVAGTVLEIDRD